MYAEACSGFSGVCACLLRGKVSKLKYMKVYSYESLFEGELGDKLPQGASLSV